MSGIPRRRPFPFDFIVSGTGLMGGRADKQAPTLVAVKPPDMNQVAPTDYGYSAQPPTIERVWPAEDFTGGYGQRMQAAWQDKRYYYTLNADGSVQGIVIKGPNVSTVTPSTVDSTNGVSHFYEVGGILFALNGRYCQTRTSDGDWNTGRQDFGSGKAATDVVVFYTNAGGGAVFAYIAMGDSEYFYRHNGTTYTQHGSLYARAFCAVGREFYRAHATNTLAKCDTDADPWTAGNWSAANAFYIGDKSSGITRLATAITGPDEIGMVAFKTDGVYTLDDSGEDHPLYPHLRFAPDSDNGKAFGAWLNDVYVGYREGCFRMTGGDLTLQQVGPEKITGNDSPVKGRITALAGHDTFHLYGAIYNPDTGNSYLLKMLPGDVWHGSITAAFESKKITALYKSTIGAPTGHSRLYLGFSDGSIGWFTLPCNANPAACSEYDFSTTDGHMYLPTWHGMFQSDQKSLKAVSVSSLNFSSSNYAQVQYRTDPSANFTAMDVNFDTGQRQKVEFPNNTSGVLVALDLVLVSTATSATPQLTGFGLHHAVRPALLLSYELTVLAEDGLVKRDGTRMRIGADQIRSVLKTAADVAGSVTVILPDESSKQLFVTGYSEAPAWDARLQQWRAGLFVKASEYKSLAVYGSHERLMAYSHASLMAFTHGQLEAL